MLQARQLTACSLRCQHQHHVHHSTTVLVRPSAALRPAQLQSPHAKPLLTPPAVSSACVASAGGATNSSRAASVVCRDAPRPMWAAKQPVEAPKAAGGAMARMITSKIVKCEDVAELSDTYNEWGSSFDYINAAAALVKCGKLPGGGRSSLVDKLCSTWLTQLPLSGLQQCSNVLWVCARLGPGAVQRLWGPTWVAYIILLQREPTAAGPGISQDLANPFWACAKLRKLPSVDDLQLMVQTYLQPAVLKVATPQHVSNIIWALGELCQLPSWQGGLSEQDMQQLLAREQLVLVSGRGRDASNALLGIARMSISKAPVISVGFARQCSKDLLDIISDQIGHWDRQNITNAMWACGELGLADTPFIGAAVAAAPRWLPGCLFLEVIQAVTACAALQYSNEAFMQACLQQGLQLLNPQQPIRQGRSSKPLSAADGDKLAAFCCISVARLDMRSVAGLARELVSHSGVGQRPSIHPATLNKLWAFHSWLLQHDGNGLTGLLTQQQLQRGAKDAPKFGVR